jgi:thiamine phosphate synthase YjbQ (UPF0047 family)
METVAPTFVFRHTRVQVATEHPIDCIDLTDGLESLVAGSAMRVGSVNVLRLHAATRIVLASDAAPPAADAMSVAACLDVIDGRLRLDCGQRVFLVDQDGPSVREIAVVMMGEAGR